MTDPLKAFLQANALTTPAFSPDSRYHGLATAQWVRPDGEPVTFVRRRIVPQPEEFATLQLHRVVEGERVDGIAATYLGDPQQYWRLCDANGVIRPLQLTETPGRWLRIALPAGLHGGRNV